MAHLMSQNIVIMLIIILVPIIPAYLLFKMLPSRAFVKGPFQGLKVDLSGGFAGYFLIFLVLVGIRSSFQSTTSYEEWTAKGRIIQVDAGSTSNYIDQRYVTFSSPAVKSDPDGNFSLTFLVTSDGRYDFPYMYISYPGCVQGTYFLGPKEKNVRNGNLPLSIDTKKRVIDIGNIQLVNIPAPQIVQVNSQANPYTAQASH